MVFGHWPAGRGRRFDTTTALADAAAEVKAEEGETARKEGAPVRAATAASLSKSAPLVLQRGDVSYLSHQ